MGAKVPPSNLPKPAFHQTPLDLILLSMAAGGADAAGYLGLGKVFTANMTGNIVLLGIALSEGRTDDSSRAVFAVAAFVVGTCAGAWLCSRVNSKQTWQPQITLVIATEAVLLVAYAIASALIPHSEQLASTYPLIALLGISMGLQGAAVYRLGVAGVVTTVVTGTITSLLTGIMKAVSLVPTLHSEHPPQASPMALQGLVIVMYCAGAAVSGLLMLHVRTWAGFFPCAIVILVVLTRLGRRK